MKSGLQTPCINICCSLSWFDNENDMLNFKEQSMNHIAMFEVNGST